MRLFGNNHKRALFGGDSTIFVSKKVLARLAIVFCGLILSLASSLFAATASSPEFKVDLRGLGPWQRHTAAASEALTYSSVWATNAASGAKAVVKVMPVLKTKPKYLVIDLSGGTNATSYGISYLDEVPGGSWSDEYKTSKLVLRHIPAGSFIMGGRATDYPGAVNTNLHMVTITRDFYMGVFEVTQRQWELVMGNRPSCFTNQDCYAMRPVEYVNYYDIRGKYRGIQWPRSKMVDDMSFMWEVRSHTGLNGFDLPTEAQWEFACRAGTVTSLNSGMNASAENVCPEADVVARYGGNSNLPYEGEVVRYNCGIEMGSAKVGSYMGNSLGLYDMHGNVWEQCLDMDDPGYTGCVDPVGAVNTNTVYRQIRGGCWVSKTKDLSSGDHHKIDGLGHLESWRNNTVGFRLCLQGGDLPDLASASTLVNESGAGSQSWTPTRSGAYYLTHSTMNGTTNVQLASAWFEVAGCTLTLEPQGELTNGVMIAINGADEGWTVYYTTNGLAPSKASEPYVGPFSLPESGTVRAVAYNEQGVASEETMTTFTLHDALSVVGAVARQRYPWNGMVDVDLELKGDEKLKYEVEVEARDLDGGTNLPVRTVYVDAFVSNASDKDGSSSSDAIETIASTGAIALLPGTHRLTWNADADIAADGEFPRVAVSVKAAGSALMDYSRYFTISTDGYASDETLTNVPVLVRLSTAIDCFDYRDFACPSNGADMAFFDANENELPYEIDEWHTNGESLVWVKLPTMVKGTKFICAYGNPSAAREVTSSTEMKHAVWAEYAGVWHMNEDSGTAYDSTSHGLDALPNCRADGDISQMVAYENGACGRARVNQNEAQMLGNFLEVPSYDGLSLGGLFTIGGWYKANAAAGSRAMSLFNRKTAWDAGNGYEVLMVAGTATNLLCRGKYTYVASIYPPDLTADWVCLTFVYKHNWIKCYANGELIESVSISEATDNGKSLLFGGCLLSGDRDTFNGQYDEMRLRGEELSAARIKADYDMIANRKFCTYGAVTNGPVAKPIKVVTITFDPNGGTLTGAVTRVYKGDYATYGELPVPAKEGSIFKGWGTTQGATSYVKESDPVPSDDSALYAIWNDTPLYMVVDLSGGSTAKSYQVSYFDAVPSGGWSDEYKTTKLVLRRITAGKFNLQNSDKEVTLSKAFYIGIFEMTQSQYKNVTGLSPSTFNGGKLPVETVSWRLIRGYSHGSTIPYVSDVDDQSVLGVLRSKTNKQFDLPTESQWEYAYRAGSTTPYYWGNAFDGDYAWTGENSESTTHEVGTRKPNAWGLYDMAGNVWEWCCDRHYDTEKYGIDPYACQDEDSYGTYARPYRGGDWYRNGVMTAASYRELCYGNQTLVSNMVGFRIVLTLSSAK